MNNSVNLYNHANAKATSDYWFGLFYPLVLAGASDADIMSKYKVPTLKKRKDAYNEGLQRAFDTAGVSMSGKKDSSSNYMMYGLIIVAIVVFFLVLRKKRN